MSRLFLNLALLLCSPIVWRGSVVNCVPVFINGIDASVKSGPDFLVVSYGKTGMQPLVNVSIGGQWLQLVFDVSSGNSAVFVKEQHACAAVSCYSYDFSLQRKTVHICEENLKRECTTDGSSKYTCKSYLNSTINLTAANPRKDPLNIDGIEYVMNGVEAKDNAGFLLHTNGSFEVVSWEGSPVRLLIEKMAQFVPGKTKHPHASLHLFDETSGILGASGASLSCRNQTPWASLLHQQAVSFLILDFHPPSQARYHKKSAQSRIIFNQIDPAHKKKLTWSQAKQTGDIFNDGMHEFLIFHPKVCGVDLLYNTSSNWLAVIDTSGPCLTLPTFLFDRLRSRVKLHCPFRLGESSQGRLCSPARPTGAQNTTLPSLAFQLEDTQDPEPPRLHLPLERLVFSNGSKDLLCVGRADSEIRQSNSANMMLEHIAIGSLAVSALYTVVNLNNHSVGLASKGDEEAESSDDFCYENITCISTMQTYFPPGNVCEDPPCSEYMFMTLDEETKTCKWTSAIPISFGLLLAALVTLDLLSHKLYKQAIQKASEFCQ